jgi:O-antigen/teichoic acid export membrane protein
MLLFVATVIGSGINYLYHPLTARFLTPSDYGLLESFVALNYFLAVINSSFSLTVIHLLNRAHDSQQSDLITILHQLSVRLTIISWILLLSLYLPIKHLLHLTNPFLFLVFTIQILFTFVPTLYTSVLQGKLKFDHVSFLSIVSPFIKLTVTLLLLLAGFRLFGAFMGLVGTGLLSSILGFYLARKSLTFGIRCKPGVKVKSEFWRLFTYAFLIQASFTSLYNSDIILTRYYFASDLAGIFAAHSLITRIIFFISSIVISVAYPLFASTLDQLPRLKIIYRESLRSVCAICFVCLCIFIALPDFVMHFFYGSKYIFQKELVYLFAFFMSLMSLLYLNFQFLLVINRKALVLVAFIAALVQVGLISTLHTTLFSILYISIGVCIMALCITYYYIHKSLHETS